jgi:pimeloyl-ACP methyl ester carboxylesterase
MKKQASSPFNLPLTVKKSVPCNAPGTSCSQQFLSLSNGLKLLVTTFSPPFGSVYPPIIMVPGLFSVIENFGHLLPTLTHYFTIYYVETREKNSSLCPDDSVFTIESMAEDLNEVVGALGVKDNEFLFLGYSMGATVVMESISSATVKPSGIILAGMMGSFDFPTWSRHLSRIAAPFYRFIKPLLKLYITRFRMDREQDPEMNDIQSRVLDSADPRKLCATIRHIASFSLWERLPLIRCSILLIDASKDHFHNHNDALRLSALYPDVVYADLETNRRNRSGEVVELLLHFLNQDSGKTG